MVPQVDNAPDCGGIFGRKVDFLSLELSIFGNDFDGPTSRSSGRDVDVIIRGERGGDICVENANRFWVMPEEFAGLGFDTDKSFLKEPNVLFGSSEFERDNGRESSVAGLGQRRFPN